jgi:hypothetical protein
MNSTYHDQHNRNEIEVVLRNPLPMPTKDSPQEWRIPIVSSLGGPRCMVYRKMRTQIGRDVYYRWKFEGVEG